MLIKIKPKETKPRKPRVKPSKPRKLNPYPKVYWLESSTPPGAEPPHTPPRA